MLVYYWFQGRGRIITNEYLAKWYIFWDSLTRNRTDGALVRVMTGVPDPSQIEAADQRLQEFIVRAAPRLATTSRVNPPPPLTPNSDHPVTIPNHPDAKLSR